MRVVGVDQFFSTGSGTVKKVAQFTGPNEFPLCFVKYSIIDGCNENNLANFMEY